MALEGHHHTLPHVLKSCAISWCCRQAAWAADAQDESTKSLSTGHVAPCQAACAWGCVWEERAGAWTTLVGHCRRVVRRWACRLKGSGAAARRNLVPAVRAALAEGRAVLGGFRTLISLDGRPLRFMTAHQLVKTYYIAALLRPLAFLRSRLPALRLCMRRPAASRPHCLGRSAPYAAAKPLPAVMWQLLAGKLC